MKAVARWVTSEETAKDHQHNGRVEGAGFGRYSEPFGFYVGPMALAERVANAMNFTAKFSNEELKRLADAMAAE